MSPILITAAHQAATRKWWDEHREDYRLFVSAIVEEEIRHGTRSYAAQRQALIADIPRLAVTEDVDRLTAELFAYLRLPPSAKVDAGHIAVACHHRIEYLLTWNMKHIASGHVRRLLARFHDETGTGIPTICTPEALLDWEDEL